jgi:hypothetical protein
MLKDSLFQLFGYDHDPRTDPSGGVGTETGGQIQPEVKGLSGQNYDEFTLGYERLVGEKYKFSVLGIFRNLRDGVEDGIKSAEGTAYYGNPGRPPLENFPKMKREYFGLELSFTKSGGKYFDFSTSYTLSRSYGNYSGLFAQDFPDPRPNVSGQFDTPELKVHGIGLLPNDRPHVFKFFGSYRFGFGLSIGAFFMWQSGTPVSEWGMSTLYPGWGKLLKQRGTAGRTPSIADLNLRVTYRIRSVFRTRLTPRLILDLFHIGSLRKPVNFNQGHYLGVDENGNQTDPNPLYMRATRYFPPMSARLGLEINF